MGAPKELYFEDVNNLITVRIYEVSNEYMFSNPTGLFNISIPEKKLQNKNYQLVSYQMYKEVHEKIDRMNKRQQNLQNGEEQEEDEYLLEDPVYEVRDWNAHKRIAPCMIKVVLENKSRQIVKAHVQLTLSK